MKGESLSELKRIYHCALSTAASLEGIGRPISSSEDFFVFWVSELFDSRTRRKWEKGLSDSTTPPTFTQLSQFLECHVHTIEVLAASPADSGKAGETVRGTRGLIKQASEKRRRKDTPYARAITS